MKHPPGSVACHRCDSDKVVVDREYRCLCDVRHLAHSGATDEANRMRQVLEFKSDRPAICDRCRRERADRVIACSDGCEHAQCWPCADHTKGEAIAERAYRPHATVTEEEVIETTTTEYTYGGTFGGSTFGGGFIGGDVVIESDYVDTFDNGDTYDEVYDDGGTW